MLAGVITFEKTPLGSGIDHLRPLGVIRQDPHHGVLIHPLIGADTLPSVSAIRAAHDPLPDSANQDRKFIRHVNSLLSYIETP